MNEKTILAFGKRKTAIARAKLKPGNGAIWINKRDYRTLSKLRRLMIEEPIRIAKEIIDFKFDIEIKTRGGGIESQIEAARLAIARALIKATKSEKLKRAFLDYDRNLLVADTRRKEAYKPNDSKARRKRQKSKR